MTGEWRLVPAAETDIPALLALCRRAAKAPGSHWNDGYPDRAILLWDIGQRALYRALTPENTLAGMISIARQGENDDLPWPPPLGSGWELARLCVEPSLQGQGNAKRIFTLAVQLARYEGAGALRLLVQRDYQAAIHIYEDAGFSRAGETRRWGEDFFLYGLIF